MEAGRVATGRQYPTGQAQFNGVDCPETQRQTESPILPTDEGAQDTQATRTECRVRRLPMNATATEPAPAVRHPLNPCFYAGFIALATLAAYANCFRVPFVYDDQKAIPENPSI